MYYEYFVVCGVYKNKIGGCRFKKNTKGQKGKRADKSRIKSS